MSASKKLSLAVKALHLLNSRPDEPLSSLQISEKLNVNPSKLRRILSMLVKTGLIGSTKGVNGGFILKKPAERIDLQEVYCSVEEKKAFYLDFHYNAQGDISSEKMNNFFLDLFADVQVVIEDYMRKISIKDITEKVKN
jgi:Rrf2 family protein